MTMLESVFNEDIAGIVQRFLGHNLFKIGDSKNTIKENVINNLTVWSYLRPTS